MEGLNPLDILIHIINFIVTFVLLYLLLYKPVSKFMHKRRESVEQALADAAATRAEADAYLAEAKAELAATGEKARRLSHEAIENAALDAERIVDTAQDEADALLQKAREQMRQEKQAAIERAHTEVVGLASDIAARILSREVTLEDNREIAERFFHGTEGGALAPFGKTRFSGSPRRMTMRCFGASKKALQTCSASACNSTCAKTLPCFAASLPTFAARFTMRAEKRSFQA